MAQERLEHVRAPSNIYSVLLVLSFLLMVFSIVMVYYELNEDYDFWKGQDEIAAEQAGTPAP